MKLYLVKRTDEWSYEDYDSFVCFAENEEQARWMMPDPEWHIRKEDGQIYFNYKGERALTATPETYTSWAKDIKDIKATEIIPTEPKVILASFNAG